MILGRFLLRAGCFFGAGLILSTFTEKSPRPEQVVSLWQALPAFLIFFLFVISIFSIGALIRRALKLSVFSGTENGLFDLTVGSVSFYLLAYLLTAIHLFSSQNSILLWMLLALISAKGIPLIQARRWFDFAKNKWSKLLLCIPLLIVVLKLIEGAQLHLHADAYITYLPAPRIWAETGNFKDFTRFTQFFLSTSFESLFAWGTALMGLRGGAGLDLTQYFSQWCTGGIAVPGIVFASIALCERLALIFPVSVIWFPLISVYALQVPVLRWMENLAKHDIGIAFWGFSAFYFTLFLCPFSPALAFIAGLITGAAVIGKLTLTFFGICLSLHVLYFSWRRSAYFVFGGIIGGLPVFIRNFCLTHNPVFPWFPTLFPSPILSEGQVAAALHATATPFSLNQLGMYLVEMQHELPLWGILIVSIFFIPRRGEVIKVLWSPVLAAVLFTFAFRPSTEIRYQNVVLIISAALISYFGFYLLNHFPKKWSVLFSAVFAAGLVANANITTFTLFQIGSDKFKPISKRLPELSGGPGKLWIRQNLKPNDSILSMGDPHVFYTLDYAISELNQTPIWDDRFAKESMYDFENDLLKSDFSFVYIATDMPYWSDLKKAQEMRKNLNEKYAHCAAYTGETATIWNLACMRNKSLNPI